MPDFKNVFETREGILEEIKCEFLLFCQFPCVSFSNEGMINDNVKIINQSNLHTLEMVSLNYWPLNTLISDLHDLFLTSSLTGYIIIVLYSQISSCGMPSYTDILFMSLHLEITLCLYLD